MYNISIIVGTLDYITCIVLRILSIGMDKSLPVWIGGHTFISCGW